MSKGRLEAFSDGVIAIIITIMVLELSPPHEHTLEALVPLLPTFLSYILSFIFVAIYWNNHHHMMQTVKHIDGRVLWANMHLLFWLSLVPFATAWLGEEHVEAWPVAFYGVVLLCAAIAYTILTYALVAIHGSDSVLAQALGRDRKGKISLVCYLIAIPMAFVNIWISCALYVLVAFIWFIPDQRIEKIIG